MDPNTSAALIELNRVFYKSYAGDFARTRRTWPPGFDLILPHLQPAANIVDLGCGNARLLAFLAARGWHGRYLGVDSSVDLLEIAGEEAGTVASVQADFLPVDLLATGWEDVVRNALAERPTEKMASLAAACLAVLHHIPGVAARTAFLAACTRLLPAGGLLVLSTWQFLTTPRLAARILPWARIGLTDGDVEPGDYLLGWGEGAAGHRYCAYIDRPALREMVAAAGLELLDMSHADGLEGNLNLYAVCRRP